MFFSDIIGQSKVKERLIRSVREERISHAQLFSGPEGTGKLGLAIAYAQYISCRNRSAEDSCGVCPSCHKYSKLIHPDLHFVFPIYKQKKNEDTSSDEFLKQWREMVLKSPYISLNQWMDFIEVENSQATIYASESKSIIRKLSIKSSESEFKVMIVWMPEKMNPHCANKLLKMIEEPPSKTLFLLVTENEENILETIRSRTQIIRIQRIHPADLQDALQKEGNYDPETLALMVHRSGGNYIKALEFVNPGENKKFYFNNFQKMMRHAFTGKIPELLEDALEMASLGREKQKEFFLYALDLLRDYFMMNMNKPSLVYLSREEKEWGVKFAPYINERNIIPLNRLFEEGYRDISMNGNNRIIFTDTFLKVVRLIKK
jgi:DNA polymerase-3 subunit delta'